MDHPNSLANSRRPIAAAGRLDMRTIVGASMATLDSTHSPKTLHKGLYLILLSYSP